jgi:transposase
LSEITEELLRRLERASRAPLELTNERTSAEALYEETLAAEVDQFLALRDAIIRLDARLDAAGVPVAPRDG